MKRILICSLIAIIFAACSSPKAEENYETTPTEPTEKVDITNPTPVAQTDSFSVTNPTKVNVDSMKFITMIEESKLAYEAKLNELQKGLEERETTLGKMSNIIQDLRKEKEDDRIADSIEHVRTQTIIDTLTEKKDLYGGQISKIRGILDSPEQK